MATGPSGLDPRADWFRIVDGGSGRVPESQIAVAVLRAPLRSVERRYLTVGDLRPTMRSLTAYSMGKLLLAASHLENLHRAWRDVRNTVRKKLWPQISADRAAFEAAPIRTLRVIKRQLRARCYEFSAKQGYTKRKSGGLATWDHGPERERSDRPAIDPQCDLHPRSRPPETARRDPGHSRHAHKLWRPPGRGIPEAIASIMQAIVRGASAFTLSDMKDFFPACL